MYCHSKETHCFVQILTVIISFHVNIKIVRFCIIQIIWNHYSTGKATDHITHTANFTHLFITFSPEFLVLTLPSFNLVRTIVPNQGLVQKRNTEHVDPEETIILACMAERVLKKNKQKNTQLERFIASLW